MFCGNDPNEPEEQEATFSSSSTVSVAGGETKTTAQNGYAEVEYTIPAGKDSAVVSFSHSISRTDSVSEKAAKVSFEIASASTSYVDMGTYPAYPLGTGDLQFNAGETKVVSISGDGQDSLNVSVEPGQSVTICQYVQYEGIHPASTGAVPSYSSGMSRVCAVISRNPETVGEFQSRSFSNISGSAHFADTGWVIRTGTAQYGTATFESGETIRVQFTHDLQFTGAFPYGQDSYSTTYSYSRSGFSSINAQKIGTITQTELLSESGELIGNNSPSTANQTFTATTASKRMGQYRTAYTVALNNTTTVSQTVTLCETITFDENGTGGNTARLNKYSRACVTIVVKPAPIPPPPDDSTTCPLSELPAGNRARAAYDSAYSTYSSRSEDSGTSTSASGVKSNVFTSYDLKIYAKPYDIINFVHCYFPGAQAVTATNGSAGSGDHGGHVEGSTSSNSRSTVAGSNRFAVRTGFATDFSPLYSRDYSRAASDYFMSSSLSYKYASKDTYTNSGRNFTGTTGKTDLVVVDSPSGSQYTIHNVKAVGKTIRQVFAISGTSSASATAETHQYLVPKTCNGGPDKDGNPTADYDCSYYVDYHSNTYYKPSSSNNSAGSYADVYVPYNFETTARVTMNTIPIVYAGETTTANAVVSVKARQNSTLQDTYATITPNNTEVRLVSFWLSPSQGTPNMSGRTNTVDPCSYFSFGRDCLTIDSSTGSLNPSGKYDGEPDKTILTGTKYPIYDVEAGSRFCVAVGVNYTDSAMQYTGERGDTNNYENIQPGKWNVSDAVCRTIAKKPNVQIWGESIFSNGSITTSTSKKKGYNNWGSERVFGSWSEYGIIANGTVRGMASGAATGHEGVGVGNVLTLPGGNSGTYCERSPLTIANTSCGLNYAGRSGVTVDSTLAGNLLSRFSDAKKYPDTYNADNLVLYSDYQRPTVNAANEELYNYRYTYVNTTSAITIANAPSLDGGVTHVVYANGDVNINTDLLYSDYGSFAGISQIPQYLVISENGDIFIDESVTEINAWLIAPRGTIHTCTWGGNVPQVGTNDLSADACSQKLTVRGPVIARQLDLKRTAGAEPVNASIEPAEVFDLSPVAYLWAYGQARRFPQSYTTYLRELPARY